MRSKDRKLSALLYGAPPGLRRKSMCRMSFGAVREHRLENIAHPRSYNMDQAVKMIRMRRLEESGLMKTPQHSLKLIDVKHSLGSEMSF